MENRKIISATLLLLSFVFPSHFPPKSDLACL
ncbi:hypothetical protein ACB098_05G094600 [Castanea mollissima]